MAKKLDDESGELVKGKGARPPELNPPAKPGRGFPFRLLFWALLMTVAAGAGGYFTWKFREQWIEQKTRADNCSTERDSDVKAATQTAEASCKTQLDTEKASCATQISDATGKAQASEAALTKMSQNLNATKGELEELRTMKVEAEKRLSAVEDFRNKFSDMTKAGQLKVTSRRGSLVVELPSEVLFDSGKANLSRPGEVQVLQVGGILKEFKDRRFLVIGHTDAKPLKSAEYKDNWELSVARSLTVTRYLVEGGMDAKNVIAAGVGPNDPIAENKTAEGQARNRRIEIVLLPSLSELPPLPSSLDDKKDGDKKEK